MESRAKLLGHPIHPMLITFPLGLLPTAVVFDVIYFVRGNPYWAGLAFWMIAAGIIGAVVAAVFGLVDWLAIPRHTRAWRIGLFHGGGNVVVLALFVASWLLRYRTPDTLPSSTAFVLALVGVALACVTGWLGGELVDRLGVGVADDANLDAASSLTHAHPHPVGATSSRS